MALPERLGKYRLDAVIGQGAMGVVLKAYDEQIHRPVALKLLHGHLVEDLGGELAIRFQQEAQAAARCMHDNIVTVFDYGIADNRHFIAMEFVDGVNLKVLLQNEKRLPHRQATDIVLQVLSALEYAHARGVVHRDIKPANIMLLHSGRVKVADFGVARIEQSELTRTGLAIGTPSYMSPECLRGATVDARSDLYSLSTVLFELIVGRRLINEGRFNREVLGAELRGVVEEQTVATDLHELLECMLQENPLLRLQTAAEFARRLSAIVSPNQKHLPDVDVLAATVMRATRKRAVQPTGNMLPSSPSSTSIPPAVVEQIIKELIPYTGPMAPMLVRKYMKAHDSIDELLGAVASHIPDVKEQVRFKTSMNTSGITSRAVMPQRAQAASSGAKRWQPGFNLSAEQIKVIGELLAQYVGPMAPRMVTRAQRDTHEWSVFCHRLAGSIPKDAEKQEFLTKLNAIRYE